MKVNWLRNNRHFVVSFLWALASLFGAIDAMNRTGPWRFGTSLAFLAIAVVFFIVLKPKSAAVASSE
jgi:hypothetical protein